MQIVQWLELLGSRRWVTNILQNSQSQILIYDWIKEPNICHSFLMDYNNFSLEAVIDWSLSILWLCSLEYIVIGCDYQADVRWQMSNSIKQTSVGKFQILSSKLRAASATSPPPTFVPTDAVFNNFRLITDTELRKLLTTCNLKSCELDPLPHLGWADHLLW